MNIGTICKSLTPDFSNSSLTLLPLLRPPKPTLLVLSRKCHKNLSFFFLLRDILLEMILKEMLLCMHHLSPGLRLWFPSWMTFLPTCLVLLSTLYSAASYLSMTQIQFIASVYNLLWLLPACRINAQRHERVTLSGPGLPFHSCASPSKYSLLGLTVYFHACSIIPACEPLLNLFFLANYDSFSIFSSNATGSMKSLWFPWSKMSNTLLWLFKHLFSYTNGPYSIGTSSCPSVCFFLAA